MKSGNSQPASQPASRPARQSASPPACQPASLPVRQPASPPARQLSSQPASSPASQPASKSVSVCGRLQGLCELQTSSRRYVSIRCRRFSKGGRKSGLRFQHLVIKSYLNIKALKFTTIISLIFKLHVSRNLIFRKPQRKESTEKKTLAFNTRFLFCQNY